MGAGDGCVAPGANGNAGNTGSNGNDKPVKAVAKTAANSSFGANMPLMSSAFDTAGLADGGIAAARLCRAAAGNQDCSRPASLPSLREEEGPTPLGSLG